MAYYSIAFSMSHIFGHNSGMQLIDNIGFDNTWNFMIALSGIGVLFLLMLVRIVKREKVIA